VETWGAVPLLAIDAEPVSHPQDELAGILNIPAALSIDGKVDQRVHSRVAEAVEQD
jgi:hypothetical protein